MKCWKLIRSAQKPDLVKALQGTRMVWHGRISLKDADYYLYVFDSTGRIGPGSNPRVLILLDLRRRLKAWAPFEGQSDASFGYASIVQQQDGPKTYLVTVNPSEQLGYLKGALFFEKYAIFPDRIEKLGEGLELTKIKD